MERKEDTGTGILITQREPNSGRSLEGDDETSFERIAREEAIAAERANEWTLLDEAANAGYNGVWDVGANLTIEWSYPDDPSFDPNKQEGLFDGLPAMYHKEIFNSGSAKEAWAKRGYFEEQLKNQRKIEASGYAGTAAAMAAGIIDADALLVPFYGGTVLGTKVGKALTKVGVTSRLVRDPLVGAAAGLEAGAVVGIAGATLGTQNPSEIPISILSGLSFGTTIGTISGGVGATSRANQTRLAREALDEYIKKQSDTGNVFGPGSVGAARVATRGPIVAPSGLNKDQIARFNSSAANTDAMYAREVIAGREDSETTNLDNVFGRGGQVFQNWVDKSPLRSLYTEVNNLGVQGADLAYRTLVHPGGMVDGVPPAALYDAMYTQELATPLQNYHKLAMEYLSRPSNGLINKIKNTFVGKKEYQAFNREIWYELENLKHTGKYSDDINPHVKEMADQINAMHERAVDIMQGRAGEISVRGSEALEKTPGYYRRVWDGEAIKNIENTPGVPKNAIENALYKSYLSLLDNVAELSPEDLSTIRKIVRSIIVRAKALDEGIDTNLIGLLRSEGKEFLRQTLKNNEIDNDAIESLISKLTNQSSERAKPGFLKERIELDMRVPIEGTNLMLIDLLEPDLYKSMHRYVRKVSGTSALARKDIHIADKVDTIESIKAEIAANGGDPNDPRIDDILETMYSYFGAGSIGRGVDPLILNAMRVTRQSLLGTLGLTQMSELGTVLGMAGVEATVKMFPKEMSAALSGKMSPFIQELHDAFIFLDKDYILFDDELAIDLVGKSSQVQNRLAKNAGLVLAKGDKVLGYTSLFYQSMSFSQRLALSSVNQRLYKIFSSPGSLGDQANMRRLKDMGMHPEAFDAFERYVNKGVIKQVGDDLQMNFDKWSNKDLQAYKLGMNLMAARAVQKILAGEHSLWMLHPVGQLLGQLRLFPLIALQKQFTRQLRMADKTTTAAMLYNLGVAAIIYSVMETVKGRGHTLDTEKIAKGAINYSPTTGWMPMATDPLAEIMGLQSLKLNKYGPPGRATEGILPTPPVLPTLNRIGHLPGAILGAVDGVDRNEASAYSAIPILGSTYGFSALFNYMKEN